jgi:DNA repair exonuclease SbcCD nuclease subunit
MTDFTLSDGVRVHLIGDPHIGRKFGVEQGVPRHRLGERESKQAAHFSAELEADADIIIMVGDLFDNPYVSDLVAVATANAVLAAAERNPDVLYVMFPGNHDLPKNLSAVGAWVSFRKMIENRFDNLKVIEKPTNVCGIAVFPWEYDRRADEQVADLIGSGDVDAAVGHWDLSLFNEKDDHLAPVAELRAAFGEIGIYSGHYHKPGPYSINGVVVHCTGSMEPYTHAEDPEGSLYVTLPLADVLADPESLRNKYVRVVVEPGEEIPELDCLGLTHIRVQDAKTVRDTLCLDDFDWQKILRERIRPLAPAVQEFIKERIHVDDNPEEQCGSGDSPAGQGPGTGDPGQA